jgi:hypothetical protein
MNPRVKEVRASQDYTLTLKFTNGEVKIFDVKPYLNFGFFEELKDRHYFNSVRPSLGSIQWPNGQDFCPDTLYFDSKVLPTLLSTYHKTAIGSATQRVLPN